eukprot:4263196-Alexandrium_andersonii.AAC.1
MPGLALRLRAGGLRGNPALEVGAAGEPPLPPSPNQNFAGLGAAPQVLGGLPSGTPSIAREVEALPEEG